MSHFPLSPSRLTGLSASLVSAALSRSYSCVLHAAYFLRSYDNKLNQRFARSATAHSSFSLPAEPLLSLALHSNATQSPICHISPQLVNHFTQTLQGHFITFCKISERPTVLSSLGQPDYECNHTKTRTGPVGVCTSSSLLLSDDLSDSSLSCSCYSFNLMVVCKCFK